MPTWDPQQYLTFAAPRYRPFQDLVARVGAGDPAMVIDLGCGDGSATLTLPGRWPGARIIGVDSSASMLATAQATDPDGVTWLHRDVADLSLADSGEFGRVDVALSNACLQWVPDHVDLLRRWGTELASGAWLAFQVPGNHDAASHSLMREVAATHPRHAELAKVMFGREKVLDPAGYAELLGPLGYAVDAWETTYLHQLDPEDRQSDPVLEWVRGTGLRPVLDLLDDPGEREAFLSPYRAALRAAYPRGPLGVAYEFRRIFVVAQRL